MAMKAYKIVKDNKKRKKVKGSIVIYKGYKLISRSKNFMIGKTPITQIKITNKDLVHNIVKKKVDIRYQKLLKELTALLIADDSTGESAAIVLNQIEKFRQEIKNKYREYLTKKELDEMAKQLLRMKKEAKMKWVIIQDQYMLFEMPEVKEAPSVGKSR